MASPSDSPEMLLSLSDALQLAIRWHSEQRDKAGQLYILHLLRVMLSMETKEERVTALLHDSLEGGHTDRVPEILESFGMPVAEAVWTLTRMPEEPYLDGYIARVSQNSLATKVKIADLRDNLDPSRITDPSETDVARSRKYQRALEMLS